MSTSSSNIPSYEQMKNPQSLWSAFEMHLRVIFPLASHLNKDGQRDFSKLGKRCVPVSGEYFILRDMNITSTAVNRLKSILPDDAIILDFDGHVARSIPTFTSSGEDCFTDNYVIIFASEKWAGPEEGGLIPQWEERKLLGFLLGQPHDQSL